MMLKSQGFAADLGSKNLFALTPGRLAQMGQTMFAAWRRVRVPRTLPPSRTLRLQKPVLNSQSRHRFEVPGVPSHERQIPTQCRRSDLQVFHSGEPADPLQQGLQFTRGQRTRCVKINDAHVRQDFTFHLLPDQMRVGMNTGPIVQFLQRHRADKPLLGRGRKKTLHQRSMRRSDRQFADAVRVEEIHGRLVEWDRIARQTRVPFLFDPGQDGEKRIVTIQGAAPIAARRGLQRGLCLIQEKFQQILDHGGEGLADLRGGLLCLDQQTRVDIQRSLHVPNITGVKATASLFLVLDTALTTYTNVQPTQTGGQSDATTNRALLETKVKEVADLRREIQYAADTVWPARNSAKAGIRVEFKIPPNKALK